MFGFHRIATCTPTLRVADTAFNTQQIIDLACQASGAGAAVAVFPELAITGATCGDLFFDPNLLERAEQAMRTLCLELPQHTVFVIGSPVRHLGKLYNAAIVYQNGQILGIVPKTCLGGGRQASQKRWFASAAGLQTECCAFAGNDHVLIGTDTLFTGQDGFSMAVEVGEDAFSPASPGISMALSGATLIAVPAAMPERVCYADRRTETLAVQSRSLCTAIAMASAGITESTTDGVFSGHQIVVENGSALLNSRRFQQGNTLAITDVDLQKVTALRLSDALFRDAAETAAAQNCTEVTLAPLPDATDRLARIFPRHPFIADTESERNDRAAEIFAIQTAGLAKRFMHCRSQKLVLGISGGLDSTLALLVAVQTLKDLGHPASDLITVTMPGFGTTGRTYTNAVGLCKALQTTLKEISIRDACIGHFKDIGHDLQDRNVVYENTQARERTQILLDIANQVNGIAVGTGDLSEAAMGWCTFNGDHISMYSVNCTVPKTLIPSLITWYGRQQSPQVMAFLQDVIDTPVSPELLPADASGNIQQKTEDIIGPYEVHDFFLYHYLKYGASPEKLLFMASRAFGDSITEDKLKSFLNGFLRRFFTQQFKRSCCPDGPQVGSVALSPRGALAMPSDAVNYLS